MMSKGGFMKTIIKLKKPNRFSLSNLIAATFLVTACSGGGGGGDSSSSGSSGS